MRNSFYENPANVKAQPGRYRPTRAEVREWTAEHLRRGMDPDEDDEGEPMGPEFDGFEETLSHVRDMYSGQFTEDEFAEVARGAFEDALSEVVEEDDVDLDAETHRTLDGFRSDRLKFDPNLVAPVLDGSKNATVRYDLDRDLRPGDRIRLETRRATFAEATVAGVVRCELGNALSVIEEQGYQHNAESVADLWVSMNRYYSDDLGLSTVVSVVLLDAVEEVR